ncbi:MAG: glycerate kinase [Comamonadaceae bacterium PBBC1]|nr:MAG: glycerate kinase [Comamonadaceae bacterium PBBC1]
MNFNKILAPAAILIFTIGAWQAFQWAGIALALGGVVMWILLHFTRMVTILKKAADRPIGHVASAVMLNAKLKKGATLMHVIAMTRSLGELLSEKDTQPEVYRWTDNGQSHVTCTFAGGKLSTWTLQRPTSESASEDAQAPATVTPH